MGIFTDRSLLSDGELTDTGKANFLSSVHDLVFLDGQPDFFPDCDLPPIILESQIAKSDLPDNVDYYFYDGSISVSEHQEKHEQYHQTFLKAYEIILNVFDIEPLAVIIQDPTLLIQKIIQALVEILQEVLDFISDIKQYVLDRINLILSKIDELIEIILKLPIDAKEAIVDLIKFIIDLFEWDREEIEPKIEEKIDEIIERIKELIPDINIGFNFSIPSIPVPLLDIPGINLPDFRLDIQFLPIRGIFDLFGYIISLIVDGIQAIVDGIRKLLQSLKDGIQAFLCAIIEILLSPVIQFLADLSSMGNVMIASLLVFLKRITGGIVCGLIAILIGDGLILEFAVGFFEF